MDLVNSESFPNVRWAHTVGEDGFGVYADLRVGEAKQRFRYIMPGSFITGYPEEQEFFKWFASPKQEMRRKAHVQGFWMSDTPCTWALWLQVMGNPLNGKDPLHFVEGVSWDKMRSFLKRLSGVFNLSFRFPSVLEWDYACRAGSEREFLLPLDRCVSPEGTQEPNPWGLYGMFGNIHEACERHVRPFFIWKQPIGVNYYALVVRDEFSTYPDHGFRIVL